jgi:hypothetical protein
MLFDKIKSEELDSSFRWNDERGRRARAGRDESRPYVALAPGSFTLDLQARIADPISPYVFHLFQIP